MKKIWLWVLIPVLCLILLAGALFMIQVKSYDLTMQLLGEPIMAVEVGQEFADPGVKAESYDRLRGFRETAFAVQGTVDSAKEGIYTLTYQAEFHGLVCCEERQVHVVKSVSPVITLVQNPDNYTLPGSDYVEEGYTATDWYDGDITHLVQRTVEEGAVIYTVTSSTGRTTTVRRDIIYNDPFAPELILTDGESITVAEGKPFQDPGFTATDNLDGDLTAQVQVTGQVDTDTLGEYMLTYTVTDSWGNTTTAVRKVTVDVAMKNPTVPTGKTIYLTFDDGPSQYTDELLDILAKYDVKATFFVVSNEAIGMTARMVAEGHSVGIHSITHNYAKIYASDEAYYNDLYGMQAIIAKHTGQKTYLLRFPGGSSNLVSAKYSEGIMSRLTKSVRANGFRYFDWNVDSNDAGGARTADEVFQNVINGIAGKKTAVVLQHDTQAFSVAAVERIILWGLENGYTFLPLTTDSPSCAHRVKN